MSMRQKACRLIRKAYLAEQPFDIIRRYEVPTLCDRFANVIGDENAKIVVSSFYLETVFLIRGYRNLNRVSGFENLRRSLLAGQVFPADEFLGDPHIHRRKCLRILESEQKRLLEHDWVPVRDGVFENRTGEESIVLGFDTGSWRANLDLRLKFLIPPVSVSATRLFGVDFERFLVYQPAGIFERNLTLSMDIVFRFVSGIAQSV